VTGYLVRRLLLVIPTLLLITVVLFLMIRLTPGSIVDLMVDQMAGAGANVSRQDIEHALGLDVPMHIQYGRWMVGIFLHGNLGTSFRTNTSATVEIVHRIPVTFELGSMALLIALVVAIPIGIYSAVRQDTWSDYLWRSVSVMALAVPGFWVATLLIVYGSVYLNWSPSPRYIPFTENPVENIKMFVIPAAIIGMALSGGIMRYARTLMLEVLRQDYVRTAWAKGLSERVVVYRHALRNTLIPLITVIAPEVSMLIGGSVIMEQIFVLPGMGRYLLEAVMNRDYLVVSGTTLVFATFTMLLILATDLSYAYLDPRVRLQ
jgi:peptide/nickel transport system permease protein